MTTRAAQALVAEALGRSSVLGSDSLSTLSEWDSLGHMHIVLAVEAEKGAQLTPEQIVAIGSVADVAALLAG